MPKEKKKGD